MEAAAIEQIPMIYKAINAVMKSVGFVGKDQVNKTQNFKFRGIDDVMNALYPAMVKNKVFAVPEIIEQTREERLTKSGTNMIYSICRIRYTFFAEDGSSVHAVVVGEGMDSGDKATNKAMAIAFKYACFQVFCIPTEEMTDPDAESHETAPKQPKKATSAPPKQTVKALGSDAEKNEKLKEQVGVERIDQAKLKVIQGLINKKGTTEKAITTFYHIEKLEDMTVAMYMTALKKFDMMPDKQEDKA